MATHYITKISFDEQHRLIKSAYIYERDFYLRPLSEGSRERNWMVEKVNDGDKFITVKPNINNSLDFIGDVQYDGFFHWGQELPKDLPKRKTFLSYYHADDQKFKNTFQSIFGDLIINKSVNEGDINPENQDTYTKRLIQEVFLKDTTILIILIGPNTKNRKHIDWEISGALNYKVGNKYSGLLGLLLPSHPDFYKTEPEMANLPKRFAENLKSGYAILHNWTENRVELQQYIEEAQYNRQFDDRIVNREIIQRVKNTVGYFPKFNNYEDFYFRK